MWKVQEEVECGANKEVAPSLSQTHLTSLSPSPCRELSALLVSSGILTLL
jgi:hypothetical protein